MKPSYYPGDRVAARNYRKKPPIWEDGEVLRAEVMWINPEKWRISYEVLLDRVTQSGKRVRLYVGADQVIHR